MDARPAALAPGFAVKHSLPYRLRRMLGPFICMDYAGPGQVAPGQLPTWMCYRTRTSGLAR